MADTEEQGGDGRQEPDMRGLGGLRRSLCFLLGVLGSQGRVPSRGEEQMSNVTGPLWLPCGGEFGGD